MTPDATTLLDGVRNGTWLDGRKFPSLRFAVPGLIPEGATLLVGPPKTNKSWTILDVALAIASGGVSFGVLPVGDPRPVLYCAFEDGDRRLQDRCRRLLTGQPIPALFHYLTQLEQPGTILATVEAWLDGNRDAGPLVIVDTLGRVMPPAMPGESAYGRDYRVGAALKKLADSAGVALVVVHHDRKQGATDFVDSVSGTNGLAGAFDTVALLTRERHDDQGVLHVTGRDVPEGEYAVKLNAGAAWQLDGKTLAAAAEKAAQRRSTANLGDRSGSVVEFVNEHAGGVGAAEVADALDIDKVQAGVYLSRAAKAGRIERAKRGLYTPVISVKSVGDDEPFRDPSNTNNTNNGPTETDELSQGLRLVLDAFPGAEVVAS